VDKRFRRTQSQQDGGWPYTSTGGLQIQGLGGSTRTMTCAGLIGLACGYGVGTETALRTAGKDADLTKVLRNLPDPGHDPQIKAGLKARATFIATTKGAAGPPAGPAAGPAAGAPPAGNGINLAGPAAMMNRAPLHYFLWSVERIAVCYGLENIEGKEWYPW